MLSCMVILLVILTAVYLAIAVGLMVNFGVLKSDIIEYICNQNRYVLSKLDDNHNELLTEIACLATKNNADIQRVREGYKPGDVIEYDGDQYLVLKINHVTAGVDIYRLYDTTDGEVTGVGRDDVDKNSKFLRHLNLLFGEAET